MFRKQATLTIWKTINKEYQQVDQVGNLFIYFFEKNTPFIKLGPLTGGFKR